LLKLEKPFKIFEIYEEFLDAPSIPTIQLIKLFEPTFEKLKFLIKELRYESEVIVLGTPPPKPKIFIDSLIRNDHFFVNSAIASGIEHDFIESSSDELRVCMWNFIQSQLEIIANENNCIFLPVPSKTIESNGLLKSEYWSDDITHANEDFGALMLDEILKKCKVSNA
jgi:hypothetical protein